MPYSITIQRPVNWNRNDSIKIVDDITGERGSEIPINDTITIESENARTSYDIEYIVK